MPYASEALGRAPRMAADGPRPSAWVSYCLRGHCKSASRRLESRPVTRDGPLEHRQTLDGHFGFVFSRAFTCRPMYAFRQAREQADATMSRCQIVPACQRPLHSRSTFRRTALLQNSMILGVVVSSGKSVAVTQYVEHNCMSALESSWHDRSVRTGDSLLGMGSAT